VGFGAGVETVAAADAPFAFVDDEVVPARVQFVPELENVLGTRVDAPAASFAFEMNEFWIGFA
jgi:hypothetical protein